MAYKMKGSTFYGKPANGKIKSKSTSPFKGIFGKILNPAQMIPGKVGEIAGKLNPFSKL